MTGGLEMPTYQVDIEGEVHEWPRDTITVAELRKLAGYGQDQQMIEVDLKDNTERVLADGEAIELKPGKGFAKKVSFKRG
jgi:Multiubiquitin